MLYSSNLWSPQTFYKKRITAGWEYRKKITIDNTNVDSDQSNFPLYIKFVDDADIGAAVTNVNGYDIQFRDSDEETILSYQRINFSITDNKASGHFIVKIPTITATSAKDIYIYYGNSTIEEDQSDRENTWNSTYDGAFLCNDLEGSTSNNEIAAWSNQLSASKRLTPVDDYDVAGNSFFQGVAVDDDYIYVIGGTSTANTITKYNKSTKAQIVQNTATNYLGDGTIYNGKLYVTWNNFDYVPNTPQRGGYRRINVDTLETELSFEFIDGYGWTSGITYNNGYFWVTYSNGTSLSRLVKYNVDFVKQDMWQFPKTIDAIGVSGIQGITWINNDTFICSHHNSSAFVYLFSLDGDKIAQIKTFWDWDYSHFGQGIDYDGTYFYSADGTDNKVRTFTLPIGDFSYVDSKVYKGIDFNGTDDVSFTSIIPNPAKGSLVCLFNGYNNANNQVILGAQDGAENSYLRCFLSTKGGKITGALGTQGNTVIVGTTALTNPPWYLAMLTWDGSNVKLYLNGNLEYSGAQSGLPCDNNIGIGNNHYVLGSVAGWYTDGIIDLALILNTNESLNYNKFQYNNLVNANNELTFSSQEDA